MILMHQLLTILAEGCELTPSHAADRLSKSKQNVQNAFDNLVRRGLAVSVCGAYRATTEGMEFIAAGKEIKSGQAGPGGKPRVVVNTMRSKAWRAMRIKGKFDTDDLARACLDGSEIARDPTGNLRHFISSIAACGYLVEMKRRTPGSAPTSPGKKRWMLVRNTGPKTPILHSSGDVWDPNEERLYTRGGSHE